MPKLRIFGDLSMGTEWLNIEYKGINEDLIPSQRELSFF